jgi:hypothetical protein
VALGIVMWFWLVFIQVLALDYRRYKLLNTWTGYCSFYFPKTLFVLTYLGVAIGSVVLASLPQRNQYLQVVLPDLQTTSYSSSMILDTLSIVLIAIWIVWFLHSTWLTSNRYFWRKQSPHPSILDTFLLMTLL